MFYFSTGNKGFHVFMNFQQSVNKDFHILLLSSGVWKYLFLYIYWLTGVGKINDSDIFIRRF